MPGELEQFIIRYSVEAKGAADRLDSLHEKLSRSSAALSQSKSQAADFFGKASGELGKLLPGVQGIGTIIRALAAEAGIATAALAVIAYGVKAASDISERHAAQRQAGLELGVSGARIEEYQRKFVNRSGGRIDREQALQGLRNFQARAYAAYSDPTRLGSDARVMKMLGVDVGERGAAPNDLNSELVQLASGLQRKSAGQVQGIAQVLGVQQDWLVTVQRLGPSIGKITEMTAAEVDNYQTTAQACAKFNAEMAKLKEKYAELQQAAAPLLDPLTKLIELMEKSIEFMFPKNPAKQAKVEVLNDIAPDNPILSFLSSAWGLITKGRSGNNLGADIKHLLRGRRALEHEAIGEQDKRDAEVSRLDEVNRRGVQLAQLNATTLQQFAGAVQSFADAIDISAAWAAWAGGSALGNPKGTGKPGDNRTPSGGTGAPFMQASATGSSGPRSVSNNPGNLEYGDFAIANGTTGSDDRVAIFPSMEAGRAAQQELLRDSYVRKGLDAPRHIIAKQAPASENDQSAHLSFLASRGFDLDAPIKDVCAFVPAQELSESGYNPKVSPTAAVATVARNTAVLKTEINRLPFMPQDTHATLGKLIHQSASLDAVREFVSKQRTAKPPVTPEDLQPLIIDIDAHGKDAKAVSRELIERLRDGIRAATG
jgi:hypothetical protein